MGLDVSDLEQELLKELRKEKMTPEEASTILKQLRKPEVRNHNVIDRHYGSKRFKIGVVSDLHFGHKNFRPDVFDDSVKAFNDEKVDEIYIPGDIIEGISGREGHVFELAKLGVTAQVAYAADHLIAYKQPITAILGNHDLWAMKKMNQGVHVGEMLQREVKGLQVVGDMSADIKVNPNLTIRMTHEGATAYALSYSLQKRINALTGGTKPSILLNGHLHKQLYMFYRNIHAFECGTLESQTEFMAMKGTPAHVGFMTLDVSYNNKGVVKVSPTFYPYYD